MLDVPRVIDLSAAADADLVAAIEGRDEGALAEAYRRHGGSVYALARRVLASDAQAEEIVEEVFVTLWQRKGPFDRACFDPACSSLRGQLLLVGRKQAIDLLNAARVADGCPLRSAGHVANHGLATGCQGGYGPVCENESRASADLRGDRLRSIELAYFGGYTYRQVAVMLGRLETTVMADIRSGLADLARLSSGRSQRS